MVIFVWIAIAAGIIGILIGWFNARSIGIAVVWAIGFSYCAQLLLWFWGGVLQQIRSLENVVELMFWWHAIFLYTLFAPTIITAVCTALIRRTLCKKNRQLNRDAVS